MTQTRAEAGIEEAVGERMVIRFATARCIHARNCVLGLPGVFKANVEGPWIDPDAASPEAIVAAALNCPSGAITYARRDGRAAEAPPAVNLARVRENGPLALHGALSLGGEAIGTRTTLCRCGASANKPFCDGSHVAAGFAATGEPASKESKPLAARDGTLAITAHADGPLQIAGALEIVSGTGRTITRTTEAWLCRCGHSANKPYCDGSHQAAGFRAPAA